MDSESSSSTPPLFFDSHCHFDFTQFDIDRASIWQTCGERGVVGAIIPGVDMSQWRKAESLCRTYKGLYYSAGIHPWWIDKWMDSFLVSGEKPDKVLQKYIAKELESPLCLAVGECGLDKKIHTPFTIQLKIFEYQLKLASDLKQPIIIHCYKAHNELITSLKKIKPVRGGVIHAFSGSLALAKEYWSLGFYLGVGGTITYPRANKTRNAIKSMPLESLLLETDAPDMPISGKQGQRNSPIYIPNIAQTLAELKGESLENIAQQTLSNTLTLFDLPRSF